MSKKLKLSVAMCTYNGARFIAEQLDSLLNQTLPLDEIIICDDKSSDGTQSIILNYVERFPDIIKLHNNETNQGVCANFDKAIQLCTGDIIFLADQDDIWYENKTQTIVDFFCKHPNKHVVFTDADLIDVNGDKRNEKPKTLFQSFAINRWAMLLFHAGFELDLIAYHPRATGATMAIRKCFIKSFRIDHTATSKNQKPLHDEMISIYAAEEHRLGFINKTIMGYRYHSNQQCGPNLKYHLNNRIFSVYCCPNASRLTDDEYFNEETRKSIAFIRSRTDDRKNLRRVLAKYKAYFMHYRIFAIIILMHDIAKALISSKRHD